MAAFGAFTQVSWRTPQKLKNLFGPAAYVWEGAKSLPRLHGRKMKIETYKRIYRGEYIYGSLSNAVSLGGILRFSHEQVDLSDGRLELLLIRTPRTPGDFFELVRALTSRRFDSPLITLERVRRAKVIADPRVSWALDGEFQPGVRQAVLEASPGAVSVIVPRSPER